MIPKGISPHKEVSIPKWKLPFLPKEYKRTDLGDQKGAIAQYRGPNNVHVLEYENEWRVHWDFGDPRTPDGLLVHVFADAPEVGFSLLAAVSAGKRTYDETQSVGDAIVDAAATGLSVYAGVKLTKAIISWLSDMFSKNSKI